MPLFKITLKPIEIVSKYSATTIKAGRKEKLCEVCSKTIPIGDPAITYARKFQKGAYKKYESRYCCLGRCHTLLEQIIYNETNLERSTDTSIDAGQL